MDAPFEVLEVGPDADDGEIEAAYRRRVKETHPDQGGTRQEFLLVRAAYEELRERRDGIRERPEEAATDRGFRGEERNGGGTDGSRIEYLNYEVLDDNGWSLDDGDLFEKAAEAGLDPADYGRFLVGADETLLEAAENRGFSWPFACRGGACANCAIAAADGELSMPINHILPEEAVDRGIRLSCVGSPTTDEMRVVYNVKHLPDLDDLRLPPFPFERARADD